MATYVNDLRLTELATGEGSGTWGTTTNLNLELIGEALGYGTQDCFATDADATTTVADGASDPARAMYFKVTSTATLTATRTLTIAPNTMTRVMLIENATTGSQSIAISQGSGGNVTIANGAVKMVYLDGAGAGAAVVDALADLELGTITVANLTATTADINGGTIDGATIGGASAAAGTFTTLQADTSLNVDGTVTADGLTVDGGADVNGEATIGSSGTQVRIDSSASAGLIEMNGSSYDYIRSTGVSSSLYFQTNGATTRQRIHSNGDISFYEDTGTTAKFFWDASAERLGLGTSSPSSALDVAGTVKADGLTVDGDVSLSEASPTISFTDTTDSSQHLVQSINSTFNIQGQSFVRLSTAATKRFDIDNNGDISFYEDTGTTPKFFWDASAEALGIGTSSPNVSGYDSNATALTVSGTNRGLLELRGATGANSTQLGAIRFLAGSTSEADIICELDGSGNGFLTFDTNGSEAMRIGPTGGVSIGNTVDLGAKSLNVGTASGVSVGDFVGQVNFQGYTTNYGAGIQCYVPSTAPGIDYQDLRFHTSAGPSAINVERMRIASTGEVGIGTSSPQVPLHIDPPSDTYGLRIQRGPSDYQYLRIGFNGGNADFVSTGYLTTKGSFRFLGSGTSAPDTLTEYMRIDSSGNLLVGTTSEQGLVTIRPAGGSSASIGYSVRPYADTCTAVNFRNAAGTQIGNISITSSATAYNTSSDARLKENIADAEDASSLVDAIKVRQFDWKADGSHQRYGMVAQELLEVAPEAVSGDPESDDMMGVDYSKLVPMLVKEIQSLRARVHALESK